MVMARCFPSFDGIAIRYVLPGVDDSCHIYAVHTVARNRPRRRRKHWLVHGDLTLWRIGLHKLMICMHQTVGRVRFWWQNRNKF